MTNHEFYILKDLKEICYHLAMESTHLHPEVDRILGMTEKLLAKRLKDFFEHTKYEEA